VGDKAAASRRTPKDSPSRVLSAFGIPAFRLFRAYHHPATPLSAIVAGTPELPHSTTSQPASIKVNQSKKKNVFVTHPAEIEPLPRPIAKRKERSPTVWFVFSIHPPFGDQVPIHEPFTRHIEFFRPSPIKPNQG
jgi:hypothetical protein